MCRAMLCHTRADVNEDRDHDALNTRHDAHACVVCCVCVSALVNLDRQWQPLCVFVDEDGVCVGVGVCERK